MATSYVGGGLTIQLTCLAADGGSLATALNAASLALIRAGIPLSDIPVCSSVAYLDGKIILGKVDLANFVRMPVFPADPTAAEISAADAELTLGLLQGDKSVSIAQNISLT